MDSTARDLIKAKAKLACRVVTTVYDSQFEDLIEASFADLVQVNACTSVSTATNYPATDPLIVNAICTYVRANFGSPSNYEQLQASYNEQKSQLKTATGYTDWGNE